ncbi:MAG: class I SAM-dependent methyltransferase [Gammaproteobacteria bacterium]|nr:class I SAM-dependent methyltransferase [Gammaproteobacteria bacterium]
MPLISATPDISQLTIETNEQRTSLVYYDEKAKKQSFYIDFNTQQMAYRLKKATLRNELLARAIGAKPRDGIKLVDATAGLGRDGFLLAWLGFNITLIERSTTLCLLLENALNRAQNNSLLAKTVGRIELVQADALIWLKENPAIDVIYLDPMFPVRKKSAAVKKEMTLLQSLVGQDEDASKLFEQSLTCATQRVVVKRPRLSTFLTDQHPNFSLTGRSARFDIYLV